jgi:hypothetical protein
LALLSVLLTDGIRSTGFEEVLVMHRTVLSRFPVAFVVCLASWPAVAVPFLPDFSAAVFDPQQTVDHVYFPMTGKKTFVFQGRDEDGPLDERFELTNIGPGPVIAGVQTSTKRDRAYEDGLLVEETFDYYAQDTEGNVWYLGEDVTNFIYDDDGNLIDTNTQSSWRAGVNGALPGFIMPADLIIGFNYYQEFAAEDDALDQGTILAFFDTLELDIGTFEDVLQILDTSELDPDAREFKYYAPGFGLILAEEGLTVDFVDPEAVFELTRIVPEPSAIALLCLGLAGMGIATRRTQCARKAAPCRDSRR